jgi:voltage-gated potassium channel
MSNSRLDKLRNFLLHLFWQERAQIKETFRVYLVILTSLAVVVIIFGLFYYLLLLYQGTPRTLMQCFYFVWITFATIGYSDEGFTGNGLILFSTIIVGTYLITRFIVLSAHVYARIVVEEVYNLKVISRMKKSLETVHGHFLIFGDEAELVNKIIEGLVGTREVYLISEDRKMVDRFHHKYPELRYIPEKPFNSETMDLLHPEAAAGAYALYRADEKNILLCAMLGSRVRVISSYSGSPAALNRFHRVGVEPISPHFSSGLKIVSTLVRPRVTEFLDRFVFPDDGVLEFRVSEDGGSSDGPPSVPLAALSGGRLDFSLPIEKGQRCMVLGFRPGADKGNQVGRIEADSLPTHTDRFLILGGGTIGGTVAEEVLATRREAVVVEPDARKIEDLRRRFGEKGIEYVLGDGSSLDFGIEEFDGVAIVTPVDEINFAIGLDFIGSPVHRVVRAVDDDMESHYRRIGAVPVFIGRVGSQRMLREVTNKFVNEVLHNMLAQHYRLDEVCLVRSCPVSEIAERFSLRVVAVCRDNICRLAPDPHETLQAGDTLIICGGVDENRKLRLANRVQV